MVSKKRMHCLLWFPNVPQFYVCVMAVDKGKSGRGQKWEGGDRGEEERWKVRTMGEKGAGECGGGGGHEGAGKVKRQGWQAGADSNTKRGRGDSKKRNGENERKEVGEINQNQTTFCKFVLLCLK